MKCLSEEDYERLAAIQSVLYEKRITTISLLDEIAQYANEIGSIRNRMIACPVASNKLPFDHKRSENSLTIKQSVEGQMCSFNYIKTCGQIYFVEIEFVDEAGNYCPIDTSVNVNKGSINYLGTDGIKNRYSYTAPISNVKEEITFSWADGCTKTFDEAPWVPDDTNGPIINASDYVTQGEFGQNDNWKAAMDAAAGGRLVIPSGNWWIESESVNRSNAPLPNRIAGLVPPANTTIELQCGAFLQQEKTEFHASEIIIALNNDNVHVRGLGTIKGELSLQTPQEGKVGENTMLIWVRGGASNWSILGPTLTESWGDGILIGASGAGIPFGGIIDCVDSNNNRRQGISVVWSDGLEIGGDVICRNTGQLAKSLGFSRQLPTAGIDIEQEPWSYVNNLVIGDMISIYNIGCGYVLQSPWLLNSASATFNQSKGYFNGDVSGDNYNSAFSQRRNFEFKEGATAVLNQTVSVGAATDGYSVDDLFLPNTNPLFPPDNHSNITFNEVISESNGGCGLYSRTQDSNPNPGVTVNSLSGFSNNAGGNYCKIAGSADIVNP